MCEWNGVLILLQSGNNTDDSDPVPCHRYMLIPERGQRTTIVRHNMEHSLFPAISVLKSRAARTGAHLPETRLWVLIPTIPEWEQCEAL